MFSQDLYIFQIENTQNRKHLYTYQIIYQKDFTKV